MEKQDKTDEYYFMKAHQDHNEYKNSDIQYWSSSFQSFANPINKLQFTISLKQKILNKLPKNDCIAYFVQAVKYDVLLDIIEDKRISNYLRILIFEEFLPNLENIKYDYKLIISQFFMSDISTKQDNCNDIFTNTQLMSLLLEINSEYWSKQCIKLLRCSPLLMDNADEECLRLLIDCIYDECTY